MDKTPKDITAFIALLQNQLSRMDPDQRKKAMIIIQDLIKLAQDDSDQVH